VIDGTLKIKMSPVASGIMEVSEGAFTVANSTQVLRRYTTPADGFPRR
jgi:hypothetical protein